MFEQGEWVSCGACGLPYCIKGKLQSLSELVSLTPEELRQEREIDLRTGHEVVDIDPSNHTDPARGDEGEVVQAYDHLLVATGAEAVTPPIDGLDRTSVYTLGSTSDDEGLREYVGRARSDGELQQPDRGPACQLPETPNGPVGIAGGGYIGVEMAEALAENGFEIRLFQRGDRILKQFSAATSEAVLDHLDEQTSPST